MGVILHNIFDGAGTWVELSNSKNTKFIAKMVNKTYAASRQWDFSLLDMKIRIGIEKLMIIIYIRNLPEDSLAVKYMRSKS